MEVNPLTNEFVIPPESEVLRLTGEIRKAEEHLQYLKDLKAYYEESILNTRS